MGSSQLTVLHHGQHAALPQPPGPAQPPAGPADLHRAGGGPENCQQTRPAETEPGHHGQPRAGREADQHPPQHPERLQRHLRQHDRPAREVQGGLGQGPPGAGQRLSAQD